MMHYTGTLYRNPYEPPSPLLEITQVGMECHEDCTVRRQMGDCVMPRECVFARVLRGGTIRRGDPVELP